MDTTTILPTPHSKWSPSASKRWMECPASIREAASAPYTPPSSYALKGTSVAKVAELCVAGDHDPESFVGRIVAGEEFTAEDVEPLRIYINLIRELTAPQDGIAIPEVKLNLESLWPGLFGYADLLVVGNALTVADLKWGEGVYVSEVDNPQLMIYALGAILEYDRSNKFPYVELIICQPRYAGAEPVRRHTISVTNLWRWAVRELLPALRATENPSAVYKPGDWCRFCPARATCPALREFALTQAQEEFAALPASSLGNADLGRILDKAAIVENWINAVRDEALGRVQRGEEIPGYILGQGRTTRDWQDPDGVAKALYDDFKLDEDAIFETKVRSPAQIEKRLPKADHKRLADLVALRPGGAKLIRDDGRHPLPSRISEEFLPTFLS